MSNKELYGQPKFNVGHVGGIQDKEYTKDQDHILENISSRRPTDSQLQLVRQPNNNLYNDINSIQRNVLTKDNKQHNVSSIPDQLRDKNRYDPYIGFLYDKGLIDPHSNLRYNVHTINIDSRTRVKKPSVEIVGSSKIINPLEFTRGSDRVRIYHPNSGLSTSDSITLTGVANQVVTVSSHGTVKVDVETDLGGGVGECTVTETTGTIFEFTPGSKYLKIKHTHFLPVVCSYDVILGDVVFKNDPFYNNYDLSELKIEIKGFQGNRNVVANVPYYDNIPISYINTKHKLIINDPVTGRIKRNVFFIELPRAYSPIYGTVFEPPVVRYTFKIIFYYIAGIPVNLLNAEYPIDFDHGKGFHPIVVNDSEGYTIETNKISTGLPDTDGDLWVGGRAGGRNIICSKVGRVIKGYPKPNQYNIQLGKAYGNVVSAKLISSEFPNTERVVKQSPENKRNNRIYWQNLDDGDHVYVAEIPAGNYKSNELTSELEAAFFNTKRINYDIDNPSEENSSFARVSPPYTNHNYIRVTIDEPKDLVTFRAYIEKFFYRPIITVNPEIPTDPSADPETETIYTITINHPGHNLEAGDKILIAGAVAHLGIPADIINNEHSIHEIVDANSYKISLSSFNLSVTRTITGGGTAVGIYIPTPIRLRFDYGNTLGTVLGFRNVGESTSITSYGTVLTNNEKYEFELDVDEFGQPKTFKSNVLQLSGENYVHMLIKQLQLTSGLSDIKDFFAKILLPDSPGAILFNTFAQSNKIFYDPIGRLAELDIEFYSGDGELFDFNGAEHSFTIEIISLDETPHHTGISAKTGKIG